MLYQSIRLELPAPHVAVLVLDRPDAANALTYALFDELDHALDRIERDDEIRVWLLTGAPRADGRPWFSAGMDLKQAAAGVTGKVDPYAVVDRIDDLLKPSIAVIEGFCTTGALELAMACDLRVAGATARLSDLHMRASGLGIGGWGAAARLSRLVGVDKAKELLLLSAEVDGTEAARIGLVNRAVPDDSVMATALEMAATIAGMPRRGVKATLGYLSLQADMSKREAMRWAQLAPDLMNLELRPFKDAGERFLRNRR